MQEAYYIFLCEYKDLEYVETEVNIKLFILMTTTKVKKKLLVDIPQTLMIISAY